MNKLVISNYLFLFTLSTALISTTYAQAPNNPNCINGLPLNETACACACGWEGPLCDVCQPGYFSSSCISCNYCQNGLCSNGSCNCNYGFTGIFCESIINIECVPSCENGGVCNTIEGICNCQQNYTGTSCEECLPNHYGPLCDICACNHGTCNDTISGSGECTCDQGFAGPTCSERTCNPGCVNGVCTDGTCSCDPGFKEPNCAECLPDHFGSSCEQCPNCNHGTCNDTTSGSGECTCDQGFTGQFCDVPSCGQNCENGGVCLNDNTSSCDCSNTQFTGKLCNIPNDSYLSQTTCINQTTHQQTTLTPPIGNYNYLCYPLNNLIPPPPQQSPIYKTLYTWNADYTKATPWYNLLNDVNNAHNLYIAFLKKYNFDRVIIYNGALEWDYTTSYALGVINFETSTRVLIEKLNANKIDVQIAFYVNDAVNNLVGYENAVKIVQAVINFNNKYPNAHISGIHSDQEPSSISVYPQLEAMLQFMTEYVTSQNLNYDLTISNAIKPSWLVGQYVNNKPFVNAVLNTTRDSMMMAYSNNLSTINSYIVNVLNAAIETNSYIHIGLETQKPSTNPTPQETIYTMIANNNNDNIFEPYLTTLFDLCQQVNVNNNRTVCTGITLHHYSSYFEALYNTQPSNWLNGPDGL